MFQKFDVASKCARGSGSFQKRFRERYRMTGAQGIIFKVVEVFLFLHCLPPLIIKLKAFSCLIMLIFVSFISEEIYIK